MKGRNLLLCRVALAGLVLCSPAIGFSKSKDEIASRIRLGGFLSGGAATAVGDFDESYENSEGARFSPAGGVGAKLDVYLSDRLAVSAGVGVLSQGYKVTWEISGPDVESWTTVIFLRVPLAVLFDFKNGYQIGGGLALDAGLSGSRLTARDSVAESMDWEQSRWENHRRYNVAALILARYTIGFGRFFLSPGFEISMHMFDNIIGENYAGQRLDGSERHLNLMLVLDFLVGM